MLSLIPPGYLLIHFHRALVRPGRFDRIIAVPLPDVRGRVQILQHHMHGVTVGKGTLTPPPPYLGFTGS